MQHWSRFVRKYLLLGETFALKRFRLTSLIARNHATYKYFDALIYAAQLEQQRYDLKWSKVARRDEHGRAKEIARVELIENVAIVITTSAEIVFFDTSGIELPIFDGDTRCDCLAPDSSAQPGGAIRTRVARVTRKQGSWLRIALSWVTTTQAESPLLTVFDVQFAGRRIELLGRHPVTSELRAHSDGTEIEVHGLFGLPGADAFVVGLDSSDAPLALLQQSSDGAAPGWRLSGLLPGHGPETPPAVLSTPVRAVAAFQMAASGCYLAAAGAADGSLRFTAFDLAHNVVASDTGPTLLVHPINDLALAVRNDDPEYDYVCYVGTETGESLCLLVRVELDTRTITTKQLWRDLHHTSVIAVRPTKPREAPHQPLFGEEVVFIVTQDGHLAIHQASRSDLAGDEVSESQNFFFEGMRFDRITLPPGMTSWASPRSCSGFLAAYPNGILLYGELYAPRESEAHGNLATTTDQLYPHVMQGKLFYGTDATDERKLEDHKLAICAMVRIGGGALRNYVLRKQLELVRWDELDEVGLHRLLTQQLEGLDAEVAEERTRIKLVVKMVSIRVLDLAPKQIFEHCRPGRSHDRIASYPRVRLACKFLADYLLRTTGQSQPGALRVRMTVMHALFRVNVLWHAALDEQSARHIPLALREILTVSLRDDDRILCVETLRAVAVVLRNISVLLRRAEGEHRSRLRTSFFPLGLSTLQWLVSTILENYTRYRRHGPPLLLSTPWSYVTVLVMVIRLFPGDALYLCDQISQRGLGDSIEAILDRLRGRSARALCSRLSELWTMPFLRERAQARAVFIELFDDCNISQKLIGYEIAPGDSDYVRASELLTVYRYLALLWKINHASDMTEIPSRWTRSGGLPELTGSLAIMPRILQAFLDIARTRPEDRVARLRTQIASLLRDGERPPEAVRLVLDRVVEHWQAILEPKIPTSGEEVLSHRLAGILAERSNSLVYAIEGDATRVVSVLRYPLDSRARLEFNRDARLGRELAERYPHSFVAVHELDPLSGRAIMDSSMPAVSLIVDLEMRDPDERVAIARRGAIQLARALRCLHAEGLHHGDLRAENVFVHGSTTDPTFRLGDLRAMPAGTQNSVAALRIPSVLHDAPSASGGLESWLDLVALNLFVLEVLTGETIKPRADQRALAELAAALSVRGDEVSQVIARMLGDSPYGTVAEFEQAMASSFPEFDRKPLVGRVQAEFDVFISYDSDDSAVARALDEQLTRHGVVPYFDRRDAFPDRWWNPILRALNRSRGFAILIGDTYRPHGHQHQEVQVARPAAQKDRLPFHVFLLGANEPKEFKQEFRHDPVYRVGRDVEAMAAHIIKSFQHPIAPLRDTGAVRSASGTWPPSKTPQDMIIGPEPQLGLQQNTAVAPPAKHDADDAAADRPPA